MRIVEPPRHSLMPDGHSYNRTKGRLNIKDMSGNPCQNVRKSMLLSMIVTIANSASLTTSPFSYHPGSNSAPPTTSPVLVVFQRSG
jgi:hypothetical protein